MYNKRRNFINAQSTVVASAYDCSGAGGRKLVRMDNGWLFAVTYTTTNTGTFYLHRSKNNGKSWDIFTLASGGGTTAQGFALYTYKNMLGMFYNWSSTAASVFFIKINPISGSIIGGVITVDTGQSSFGTGCSITADKFGVLHAAWVSKNSSYPSSFNIRYSKSTDGGASWAAPTQITTLTTSGYNMYSPCVIMRKDGNPAIIANYQPTNYTIDSYYYNGSAWTGVQIYNGSTYGQYCPCAVVDGKGIIHVVWYGLDSTDTSQYNVRYSKSLDNGATWSTAVKLTSGNAYPQTYPSISVDGYGNLCVLFHALHSGSPSYYQIRKILCISGTWDTSPTTLTAAGNSQGYAQPLERCDNIGLSPFIWQDTATPAVKFMADSRIDAKRRLHGQPYLCSHTTERKFMEC